MNFQHKSNALIAIQGLGADLDDGEEARHVCPHCGGGSSREKSLSIRRNAMRLSYCCYRASCDLGMGTVMLTGDGKQIFNGRKINQSTTRQKTKLKTVQLWLSLARMLKKKYGLTDELLLYGNVRAVSDGRVAYSIFGPKRERRGYVVRKYKDHYKGLAAFVSVPKAYNDFFKSDTVGLSWYFRERGRKKAKNSNTLVLVEDIVSALRLCPYVDSCALLGTMFEPKRQKEVKSMRYKKVVLALDADATRKATKIVRQARTYLPELKVKYLDCDVKDMSEEQVNEFVKCL